MSNNWLFFFYSKQNNSLVNFVNPGNIGYFSMSVNTEAMINYYYATLKKYLSNSSYMSAYSDVVNVYIDLVQIMIDEKESNQAVRFGCNLFSRVTGIKAVNFFV